MIRICMCCKVKMGEKPPFNNKDITHACCDKCLKKYYGKYYK